MSGSGVSNIQTVRATIAWQQGNCRRVVGSQAVASGPGLSGSGGGWLMDEENTILLLFLAELGGMVLPVMPAMAVGRAKRWQF